MRLLCRIGFHRFKSIDIEVGRTGGPYAFLVWHKPYVYCEHCKAPKIEPVAALSR